jgi:hypothetical protein
MSLEETDPLRGKLERAENRLEAALGEVCEDPSLAGVGKPNTAELIRIDETLAIASDAAKQAISLRRRVRRDEKASEGNDKPQPSERVD